MGCAGAKMPPANRPPPPAIDAGYMLGHRTNRGRSVKLSASKFGLVSMVMLCLAPIWARGAAPTHGKEALRELAVFPTYALTIAYGFNFNGREWRIDDGHSLAEEISALRTELKSDPGDIDRVLHLAYLLSLDNQTNDGLQIAQQAEDLCRKHLDATPQDGVLLVQLGEALGDQGKGDEAESMLRRSVLVASNDWRPWSSLGIYLEGKSIRYLLPDTNDLAGAGSLSRVIERVLTFQPTGENLRTSEEIHREAGRCLQRAVKLGGKDPEMWIEYAGGEITRGFQRLVYRHWHDQQSLDGSALMKCFYSGFAASNLRKASELRPRDYRLVCVAAYMEYAAAVGSSGGTAPANTPPKDLLSDAARKSVHEAMTRLDDLSNDPDKKIAAGATESLAFLTLVNGDNAGAIAGFRRAVALDPSREQSWDALLGLSPKSDSLDICESRLKVSDTAFNHVLLASCWRKQQDWEKCRAEAEAALKLEPDNLAARLTIVALLIRQSTDNDSLAALPYLLKSISDILEKTTGTNEDKERYREFALNSILGHALWNYPDVAPARDLLDQFSKMFPDDVDAAKIRAALQ
jgi:tetratricopeptide (TPR) repeat protein